MGRKTKESFVSHGDKKEKIWGFFCPACRTIHYCGEGVYRLTGTLENPSIKPVISNFHSNHVCICLVMDGVVLFSEDSTHHMRGMSAELPQWLDR
jgi:hypothetical protein